ANLQGVNERLRLGDREAGLHATGNPEPAVRRVCEAKFIGVKDRPEGERRPKIRGTRSVETKKAANGDARDGEWVTVEVDGLPNHGRIPRELALPISVGKLDGRRRRK